jgi:hypothetical protein
MYYFETRELVRYYGGRGVIYHRLFTFDPVDAVLSLLCRVETPGKARRMFCDSGTDRFTGTREGSSEGARTSPQMPTQL